MKNRAVIFTNGEIEDTGFIKRVIEPDDFLISADGGMKHLRKLNLVPNLLIGDLDSVSSEEVSTLKERGVEIQPFPVEKNETDLELALLEAARRGFKTIFMFGALGGRLDQTLTNLFLLALPELKGLEVKVDNGLEEVFLIRNHTVVNGAAGDVVSLLPFLGTTTGINTQGLNYPLRGETLYPDRSRGISNVMLGEHAVISLKSGCLLCIHTRASLLEEK
jgi:thiamine pyrophosphokinase